ncbi:MAG: translation initiation factor IF-2 subunit beta [Candidatus Pacearchaeota archaeon]
MNYEELLTQAYKNITPLEVGARFEIPKVEGHHEGTRTILTNFSKIASFLRRKPEHIAKFLGKELASSIELSGERLILSRRLPSKEINEKIEKYTNCFILCPKCKKPDTELLCEGNKMFIKCLACGEKYEIHKL